MYNKYAILNVNWSIYLAKRFIPKTFLNFINLSEIDKGQDKKTQRVKRIIHLSLIMYRKPELSWTVQVPMLKENAMLDQG